MEEERSEEVCGCECAVSAGAEGAGAQSEGEGEGGGGAPGGERGFLEGDAMVESEERGALEAVVSLDQGGAPCCWRGGERWVSVVLSRRLSRLCTCSCRCEIRPPTLIRRRIREETGGH